MSGPSRKRAARSAFVELPAIPFLYTFDQVALILSMPEEWVRKQLWKRGASTGPKTLDMLECFDIDPGGKHEWRISENELLRWLARKGYGVKRREP